MSSTTISYINLLELLTNKQKIMDKDHRFVIPDGAWYWEAIEVLKMLIDSIKNNKKLQGKPSDENYWNRIFTSLSLLLELSQILDVLDTLDDEGWRIFLSKFKLVFKGPLLMSDEDSDNNLGRNTLFELSLYSRLLKHGYSAKLHDSHPDLSFQLGVQEYVIECKRIYKPETLVDNVIAARDQLKEFSLNLPKPNGIYSRYGIVAISLSRYIHKGDKLFDASTQESARKRIYNEMNKIFEENKKELLKSFPVNIPALLFEYSDRGSIDLPYNYDFISVYETATVGYSNFKKVISDLRNLND
jgi:hypothetical protein